MSVTNLINEENLTMIQGVNGILLHKEDWMMRKVQKEEKSK